LRLGSTARDAVEPDFSEFKSSAINASLNHCWMYLNRCWMYLSHGWLSRILVPQRADFEFEKNLVVVMSGILEKQK